ncbi:MAG: hypothetical protein HW392_782, partial [Steroidobacteraceae bacterium]|nr:hypothetical protein [Steroidobacteraceae bacterium]
MVSALWLLLFVSLVLWLAYQRAGFVKATIVLGVLLVGYTIFGAGPIWWKAVL